MQRKQKDFLDFLFILQNYTTVSKFIKFVHQATPWRTAADVTHSVFFKKFCKRPQMEKLQT
jgi:hypothetical protein